MFNNHKILRLLLLVMVVLFAAGIFKLFDLRFRAGDIYPAYSSFRSDPLGSRALYESLEEIDGVTVSRNFRPLHRLKPNKLKPDNRRRAFLCLGIKDLPDARFSEETFAFFEQTASIGGRVVISGLPRTTLADPVEEQPDNGAEPAGPDSSPPPSADSRETHDQADQRPDDRDEDKTDNCRPTLAKRWQVGFAHETEKPIDLPARAVKKLSEENRPPQLPWPTTLYFTDLSPEWRVIYARGERPVIIERPWGKGSIVLLSGSYLFSNESLKKENPAELLAWIAGDTGRIIFDEAHFGLRKSPGVAFLIKKYRLTGVLGVLLLLAVLLIWKRSAVLVPPPASSGRQEESLETGRDNLSGLSSMLQRRYPAEEILRLALAEWERSPAGRVKLGHAGAAEKLQRARAVISAGDRKPKRHRDPVKDYNTIS
ncbi:MAG: DUF4350 domain-containing protein, partial [Desulfosudaceae bacterium]